VQIRGEEEKFGKSLGFHWDRDENAEGQYTYPHLATVTYVTDFGAPTMVIDAKPLGFGSTDNNDDDNEEDECYPERAWLSYPDMGKHVVFAGDLLHGVPEEFLVEPLKSVLEAKRE